LHVWELVPVDSLLEARVHAIGLKKADTADFQVWNGRALKAAPHFKDVFP
jgi:hypothetical protein